MPLDDPANSSLNNEPIDEDVPLAKRARTLLGAVKSGSSSTPPPPFSAGLMKPNHDVADDIPLVERMKQLAAQRAKAREEAEALAKKKAASISSVKIKAEPKMVSRVICLFSQKDKEAAKIDGEKKPAQEVKAEVKNVPVKIKTESKNVPVKIKAESKNAPVQIKTESKNVPVKIKTEIKREPVQIPVKSASVKVKVKKENEEASQNENENDDGEEEEDEEHKWWEQQQLGDGSVKWSSLVHQGVYFPPAYVPHGIPLGYEGRELQLEPEAEEVAGFFAAMINTDHASNPIFVKNFFEDFCQVLVECNSRHANTIKEFAKCDFTRMARHFEAQREQKKQLSKAEKELLKQEKAALEERYGWCYLDGRKEKVGNFRVEPPGLFRGRGKHPKAGKLKRRVMPEQVTINCSAEGPIPQPPPGHRWASVQHDPTVSWLAMWVENINRAQKYVMLAPGSSLKGQSDLRKFETARRLKSVVASIRARNRDELRSKEMLVRQRATALWLIDRLALRAGNEKGDDEADTVGCCSLRIEHVQLEEPNFVIFDFLGKDSIRYYNRVPVDAIIFKNLRIFMRPPKQANDPLFDRLTTSTLNRYLTSLMPGLTAKVFRTFNASWTMQRELAKYSPDDHGASIHDRILAYNRANREVAILCNHQRAIPKTFEQSLGRLKERILDLKFERHALRRELANQLSRKELAKQLPAAVEPESDMDEETVVRKQREWQERLREKTRKKMEAEAEGGEGEGDDEKGKQKQKKQTKKDQPESSPPSSPIKKGQSVDRLLKKFHSLSDRIKAAKLQLTDRDENKTTSLATSKTNYIDPRITAAWCKGHEVPIEKMFNRTLREKFKWAMDVPADWRF